MCHVNLDMKQADIEKAQGAPIGLPVFYLSDLIGLALGLTAKQLGVDRHFVSAACLKRTPQAAPAGQPAS